MPKKYDVLVIGGGPAGIITAVTARKYYPDKKILLIKSVGTGVVPCGIPYMFTTLEKPEDNALGNAPLEKNNVDVKVDEVVDVDFEKKTVKTKSDEKFVYDRLVFATGSDPISLPIKGFEKKGVYSAYKEMGYLKDLKNEIFKAKDIVIIGGGFIGVEFADELSNIEKVNVSLVERNSEILSNSFDSVFSELASEKLVAGGVNLITKKEVVEFEGDEKVERVKLSDGTSIEAQVVISGVGAYPNSSLAKKAGLDIGKNGGILVDEYLRTSEPDVFAVGDCAEKKDFFTRKKLNVMLASIATAEARIAGASLFGLKLVREHKGTIAIYSTQVGDLVLGSAGMTEETALEEDFELVVGNAECVDKHPGAMPDAKPLKVKLIFSKQSDVLLGGQVAGGVSAGEILNIIGVALQKNVSITEMETLQVATHPKLTAAPTMYPLIVAAQDALMNS